MRCIYCQCGEHVGVDDHSCLLDKNNKGIIIFKNCDVENCKECTTTKEETNYLSEYESQWYYDKKLGTSYCVTCKQESACILPKVCNCFHFVDINGIITEKP